MKKMASPQIQATNKDQAVNTSQPQHATSLLMTNTDRKPDKLRKTYENLFHELQFRASKNALMNYYQAEKLDETGSYVKVAGGAMCAASSAGILAGIVQRGKILANRFGLAGIAGLPICAAVEVFTNASSDFLPSHQERAKKHVKAAAAWNRIADMSRSARLRLKQDRKFTKEMYVPLHEKLIEDKEKVQSSVVLPRELHRKFNADAESVFASIKRRKETFKKFQEYHLEVDDDTEEEYQEGLQENYYL